MAEMQEMFDLNTAIDQLKAVKNKDYNFEAKDGELRTTIHLFVNTEKYPQIVQDAYIDFNRRVKRELQVMIDALVDKRDALTMKILRHNYDTMNAKHSATANEATEIQKATDKAYEELRQILKARDKEDNEVKFPAEDTNYEVRVEPVENTDDDENKTS